MSRVANSPVELPAGVELKQADGKITIKGGKGALTFATNPLVDVNVEGSTITFKAVNAKRQSVALAGTTRAIINNMVIGVSKGCEKKLVLNGVGYRAKASGSNLNLTLGFSHPIDYSLPEGIKAETPSQTEIVISGADKQRVGQVAAEIRAFRPPEPYKGKGVKYADENIRRKDAKKK